MTHVKQRRLHHFPKLLDLLFTPSDVAVCHIWLLLHLHGTAASRQRDTLHPGITEPKDKNVLPASWWPSGRFSEAGGCGSGICFCPRWKKSDAFRQKEHASVFTSYGGNVPDSHAFLDVRGRHLVAQIHHKLCKLFHINDVFGVFWICIYDFCASGKQQNKKKTKQTQKQSQIKCNFNEKVQNF